MRDVMTHNLRTDRSS